MLLALRTQHYFTAWRLLQRGSLPAAGGWSEQDAHWVEALETIGSVLGPLEAELARGKDETRQ